MICYDYAQQKSTAFSEEKAVSCGAGNVTRTHDLLITNQLLYRLSYTSNSAWILYHGSFHSSTVISALWVVFFSVHRFFYLTRREILHIIGALSGCGEAWYRAWFGSKRPRVRIPTLRPRRRKLCIACDDFLCVASKSRLVLTPLLLLSKSNPLR